MLSRSKSNLVVAVVGIVVALCLAGSVVCVAGQSFIPGLQLPFGYVMSVCGVWDTTPQFRAGLVWQSPFLSAAIPPFGGPGNGCFMIPWLPFLPPRGQLLIG